MPIRRTYFLGHVYGQEGAGNWYFPVLYSTKLSIGFLFLNFWLWFFFFAIFLRTSKKPNPNGSLFSQNPLALSLIVFIGCYLGVAFSSTFQIGLRHIMPVIFAVSLLVAKARSPIFGTKKYSRLIEIYFLGYFYFSFRIRLGIISIYPQLFQCFRRGDLEWI